MDDFGLYRKHEALVKERWLPISVDFMLQEGPEEKIRFLKEAQRQALLDGLDGLADYDQDGVITLKELDLHVTRNVKKLTNGSQRPTTQIPANMPDFPLFVR